MHNDLNAVSLLRISRLAVAGLLSFALVACGGGGGSPGATATGSTAGGTSTTPGGGGTTPPVTPPVVPAVAALTLSLLDANSAPISAIGGTQAATLRAKFTDTLGAAVAGAVVSFTASDATLVQFVPSSASALTDSTGVATIAIKPASASAAGALAVTATATLNALTAKSPAVGISVNGVATGAGTPTFTLTLVDASGAAITSLSGGQVGTVRGKFVDSAGANVAGAVVKFTASDATLVQFTPSSGSSLTDANGVATISVTPASFNAAGALAINAQAVLNANSASSNAIGISVISAPLVVGTLSFTPTPAGALPAFSTVTLNVPVTSNGQPAATAPGLTLNSLCVGDGTATLALSSVSNGVATAIYTNKGCSRGSDLITAAIGNSTQSISLSVGSANLGTINFINSNLSGTSLVLKGTGGLGRMESALLTYKVVDQTGAGLAGVNVTFTATTTTGGLKVLPLNATTDTNGLVSTSVQSGTIPTPVRVIAQASRNGISISGLSDALTISTGLPIQKAMSMSADKYNIEGLSYDGTQAQITVRMADQYGNPISDGTTVNFIAEGGAVGTSLQGACLTVGGGCTVPFTSQSFRPANGRVTVLAYALGIEDFVDSNGDGQYSCTNFTSGDATTPATFRPLIDTCNSGGEPFTDLGDAFMDAGFLGATSGVSKLGTLDGTMTAANGDLPVPYGHTTYTAAGDNHWGINYIRQSREFIFSGSTATLIRVDPVLLTDFPGNSNTVAGLAGALCSAKQFAFRLVDQNNNPLPYGTTVGSADAIKISAATFYPALVGSSSDIGGTFHVVTLKPDTACASGSVNIVVSTPKGVGTVFPIFSN